MPEFPQAGPFNPQDPLVLPQTGIVTPSQSTWLLRLATQVALIQGSVNNSLGTNFLPLASQPALGSSDDGYVMFVTDFAHLVYWDGTAWQWMDADRPLRFADFAAAPGVGWGVCDGSAYSYLVVGGATLTTASFTTPNLSGTASYRKSAAAYTGSLVAAVAPGASLSGDTDFQSAALSGTTDANTATTEVQLGLGATVAADNHAHGLTSAFAVAHRHAVGSLAVTVDAAGDPRHLNALPYVRL